MASIHPLFLADWCDALFVHFRVEPPMLTQIPFGLDVRDGGAYVSVLQSVD